MMSPKIKQTAFLFLFGASISLILLAGSLSRLQLRGGAPFPGGDTSGGGMVSTPEIATGTPHVAPGLQAIVNLALLIIVIYVAIRLIRLLSVKRIAQVLLAVSLLLSLVSLISDFPGNRLKPGLAESAERTEPVSTYPVSPLGELPPGMLRLAMISFVVGAGLLALLVLRRKPAPATVEDQLSHQAESAVRAIQLGKDLRSVIIRCYLQMMESLQQEQGMERNANMTVREFEDRLDERGFPRSPVQQLTRLFEKARYGHENLLNTDEELAVASLSEILQFCRSKSG